MCCDPNYSAQLFFLFSLTNCWPAYVHECKQRSMHTRAHKQATQCTIFCCANSLKHLRVRELSLCLLLLPACYCVVGLLRQEEARTCQYIGWLEQRMPRPNQPGASINGRGDLKATKGTRFSDLLEPIHPQRKHDSDAIISLFPASRIRRLLISDPGPHRLCTMPCKTSDEKLKKRHILWYQSCHRMFSHSLFCVLRVGVWWNSPSRM